MIALGSKFPSFSLKACSNLSLDFEEINDSTYQTEWKVVFFWPKNFTFVCPTEIIEFGKLNGEFKKYNAQILGVSTDSEFAHLAWRQAHPGIKDVPFPMLADIKRELSDSLGIIDPKEGVPQRATFIVDPNNTIQYISLTNLNVGRNPNEVLRVLEACQNGGLMPCNWKAGQETIKPKL